MDILIWAKFIKSNLN